MTQEHKVYVPIRGQHVESNALKYSARWYEEQGIELPPDKPWAGITRWLRRAGIEFDREERYLRLWRLSISWERNDD